MSGARCRLAYGPADATATHSLASVKSRLVLPFWYRLTRVVPEKGPLNGCVCVCVCLKPSLKLKFKQKDKVAQRTAYNSAVNARNTGKAGHGTVQSWTPVHCWQYAGLHGVVHMLTVSWRDSWSCERSEWFKSSEFFNSSATNTQPHTHTTVRRLVARDYPGRPAACSNGKLITVTGEFSVNTEIH